MKNYTIKKAVDDIIKNDYNKMSLYYICYELHEFGLDLNDEFLFDIYFCYIDSNYNNIQEFLDAFFDYFYSNDINPADVKTCDDLNKILDAFIY